MQVLFAFAGVLTGVLLIELWKRSFPILIAYREHTRRRVVVAGLQLLTSFLCLFALAAVTRWF